MKRSSNLALLLTFISIIIIIIIVFFPMLQQDFVHWDDHLHVVQNPLMNPVSIKSFSLFFTRIVASLYIPVTYSVWALLAFLGQEASGLLNPWPFKMINLMLHSLNSILAWGIMRLLLPKPAASWFALVGALVFALHPLQVEAVVWVSGLKDLLCSSFALAALLIALLPQDHHSRMKMGISSVFYLLALLSKPTAVVLPLILGMIFVGVPAFEEWIKKWKWVLMFWILLAIPILWITKMVQSDASLWKVPSFLQRGLVAGDAWAFYLGKFLRPFPLLMDYSRLPQKILSAGAFSSEYWNGLFPAMLLVLLLILYQNVPQGLVGFLIFIIWTLPVSGIVPFSYQVYSTVADRYAYLGLLGMGLLCSAFLQVIWNSSQVSKSSKKILVCFMILLGGNFIWTTRQQIGVWKDSFALFSHTLAYNQESAPAHLNMATLLFKEAEKMQTGQMDQKILHHFTLAIRLKPYFPEAYFNLGNFYFRRGNYQKALQLYRKSLQQYPQFSPARNNLIIAEEKLRNSTGK